MISPVQTWDSKITTVLAINGGIVDLTRKYLKATGKYDQFVKRIDSEWKASFGAYYNSPFPGSNIDFKMPSASFNPTPSPPPSFVSRTSVSFLTLLIFCFNL